MAHDLLHTVNTDHEKAFLLYQLGSNVNMQMPSFQFQHGKIKATLQKSLTLYRAVQNQWGIVNVL
ncbi:MAG: hypothetical protein AAF633_13825 [Chloroflexota bacterium]